MSGLDRCIDEQRQAAEQWVRAKGSVGLRLGMSDWLLEEALVRGTLAQIAKSEAAD